MRLMFAALAAYGHTYPSIPLAVAAHEAGHDVVFAAGQKFLPTLEAAGLTAVPAGISLPDAVAVLDESGDAPEGQDQMIGKLMGEVIPRRWATDLAALLEEHRPDLVVYDAGTLGAGLAAEVAGIPALCRGFGIVSPSGTSDAMGKAFASVAAEFGVPGDDLLMANPYLDICPESLQSKDFLNFPGRVALRPVAWSEPGTLPDGVQGRDRSRPLVYLTLGTAFATAEVLRAALNGIADQPVDVLVTAGRKVDVAELGEVPDNVRLATWVPQAEVLRHVDLVVHHGGAGTMFGALSAVVPQLVLPQAVDQFINAEAVLTAGAGGRLLPDEVSREAVAEQVSALLRDDSVRAAARRLAAEIEAMPAPEDLATRLPELLG
jgi:UDP:flavonoid glycosyltransferase YjiC (YdhE family)